MLTNNCKVACFHLQNVSYYENTANATKGEGLVHEIQIEKYVVYVHFLIDVLLTLQVQPSHGGYDKSSSNLQLLKNHLFAIVQCLMQIFGQSI